MPQKASQRDNTTLALKVALRRQMLAEVASPVILETHGGYGHIWRQCYWRVPFGVVLENNTDKVDVLAKQRPTWAVYEADCEVAIAHGAVDAIPFNFIDLDPYGQPWPALESIFSRHNRPWPEKLVVVVNDGGRRNARFMLGWRMPSLAAMIEKYGNQYIWYNYLAICREMLENKAGQVGYTVARWTGYYCGDKDNITHYAAVLTRPRSGEAPPAPGP